MQLRYLRSVTLQQKARAFQQVPAVALQKQHANGGLILRRELGKRWLVFIWLVEPSIIRAAARSFIMAPLGSERQHDVLMTKLLNASPSALQVFFEIT